MPEPNISDIVQLLLLVGFADMGANSCGGSFDCFHLNYGTPRVSLSAGSVLPRQAKEGSELYLRYDSGARRGPLVGTIGASIGTKGESWIGAGVDYSRHFGNSPIFIGWHLMPGLYDPGDGWDLGHVFEIRSGVEFGYQLANGWRASVGVDHKSNAEIGEYNPGVEHLQFRLSVPLG